MFNQRVMKRSRGRPGTEAKNILHSEVQSDVRMRVVIIGVENAAVSLELCKVRSLGKLASTQAFSLFRTWRGRRLVIETIVCSSTTVLNLQ